MEFRSKVSVSKWSSFVERSTNTDHLVAFTLCSAPIEGCLYLCTDEGKGGQFCLDSSVAITRTTLWMMSKHWVSSYSKLGVDQLGQIVTWVFVSLLTYYFLFRISPFYIRTYPLHILLFRLRRPRLIPVTTLYPHTTVLFIDFCVRLLISVSPLAPTASAGFQFSMFSQFHTGNTKI